MNLPKTSQSNILKTWPGALIALGLGSTAIIDLGAGLGLIFATRFMVELGGLPFDQTAQAMMPALGVTLLAIATIAALTLKAWLTTSTRPIAAQFSVILGVMLIGVGLAQWLAGGIWVGLVADASRGVMLLVGVFAQRQLNK